MEIKHDAIGFETTMYVSDWDFTQYQFVVCDGRASLVKVHRFHKNDFRSKIWRDEIGDCTGCDIPYIVVQRLERFLSGFFAEVARGAVSEFDMPW